MSPARQLFHCHCSTVGQPQSPNGAVISWLPSASSFLPHTPATPYPWLLLDPQQLILALNRWWLYLTKCCPCALPLFLPVKGAPASLAVPITNRLLNMHHAKCMAQEIIQPMRIGLYRLSQLLQPWPCEA